MISILFLVTLVSCCWEEMIVAFVGPQHIIRSRISTKECYMAGNAAVFSGGREGKESQNQIPTKITTQQKYVTKAQQLRQEANEMEMALQVETLTNIPVQPLIPIVSAISTTTTLKQTSSTVYGGTLPVADLRSKMTYLSIGDAVRISYELDRMKSKGDLHLWKSVELERHPDFSISDSQLTSLTSINPKDLSLDDVGFSDKKVLAVAMVIFAGLGMGSASIDGDFGQLVGYLSALVPVGLVTACTVKPSLIFDFLSTIKYATSATACERYAYMEAGKFFVGYALGMPISYFDTRGPSSRSDFFQLRPTGKFETDHRMSSASSFTQLDMALASVVCLGGSVAECLHFGEASGSNPSDVNTLNDILSRWVQPALTTEMAQNHIRWSALTAYRILTSNKERFLQLVLAFKAGLSLEDCIAALEGDGPLIIM